MEDFAVMDEEDPATQPVPSESTNPESKQENGTESADVKRSWDFSHRKIIVNNAMKYMNKKDVPKLVDSWVAKLKEEKNIDVEVERAKKPPKDGWIVVTLKEESMCQPFIDFINASNFRNKKGGIYNARKVNDGKRPGEGDGNRNPKRVRRPDSKRPVTEEEIKNKIVPLWKLSAEEQERKKMGDMIKRCSKRIISNIKQKIRTINRDRGGKQSEPTYAWLGGKRSIEVEDMRHAPTPLRNKTEFTFGYRYIFESSESQGKDDDEKMEGAEQVETKETNGKNTEVKVVSKHQAAGFMVLGWSGGVSNPHCCDNIPPEVCALLDIVNEFAKDSPLPSYDSSAHKGFWRQLTIRTSRRMQECMIIIVHAPVGGGIGDEGDAVYAEHFEKEKERLLKALSTAELTIPDSTEPLKVTSIFFQEFGGMTHPSPDTPIQHQQGKEYLSEKLGDCTFRISPGAFFQVNTEGAEILYSIVVDKLRESVGSPENTMLFDVCCGTGTIGLTCMKAGVVGKVVGVDISEPAIKDAKANAKENSFEESTVRFVAGRAEKVLNNEISRTRARNPKMDFVAVVDPAREGLHPEVVRAIRSCEDIKRLVYVSCNPTGSLVQDATLLCQPTSKRYTGLPFKISCASPVDMFPLTDHCEMVMTFDRMTTEEVAGKKTTEKTESGASNEAKAETKTTPDAGDNKVDTAEKTNGEMCETKASDNV